MTARTAAADRRSPPALAPDVHHRAEVEEPRAAADGFSASDPQAIDRDNALRLLPGLKA